MAEFIESTEHLSELRPAVSMFGSAFWGGLPTWFRDKLVGEGMIAPEDMNLLQLLDAPQR